MAARVEISPAYDPTSLLGGRYDEENQITTISPPLRKLITACGDLLQPGWEYRDTFYFDPLSLPYDTSLSLVFENPSSSGINTRHAFAEVVTCLKPELRRIWPKHGVDGWVLPDTVVHPLAEALQSTYFEITRAELGFNHVATGKNPAFQTGVLVFDLTLTDTRTKIETAEREFKQLAAKVVRLRQSAANRTTELF